MRALLIGLFALFMVGCATSPEDAKEALDNAGYTDINTGDESWWGCGKGDMYGREFTAKAPNGRTVSGVVCCGYLKACTVRF